jgi:hypothetical protein
MCPIRAHRMTPAREEHLNAPIAVTRILRRKLAHYGHRWGVALRQLRSVVRKRSIFHTLSMIARRVPR